MFRSAICLSFLFALPVHAETWVKVQSPHFTVLSNGSLKDAREVATGFEEIHAVFVQSLHAIAIILRNSVSVTGTALKPGKRDYRQLAV